MFRFEEVNATEMIVNDTLPYTTALFSNHKDSKLAETVVERNSGSIPIGAVAEPEEVARAILFLAHEKHMTGTILSIDGGYTA